MECVNKQHDRSTDSGDAQFAAWAAGISIVLVVLASYLLTPPMTLARLGEVAGVSGFLLIVFSLLLMIRLPGPAALAGGLETLYTLHRGVGLAGYGLLLLHPLLLATQGGWAVLELGEKDLGFRLGWTGLLILMVVLVCTFILKTAGYAIWRRLHMFSVLAFLAMAGHALAYQGDWPLPGRIAFNLFLLVGLLAPVLRFWLVDRGGVSTRYQVDQVGHPATDVVELRLKPSADELPVTPGQFVFARFASVGAYADCGHFHPFTASRVGKDGALHLAIKACGPCTRQMLRLAPGGAAWLQGPYGKLFQHQRQNAEVWIAGGAGISPLLVRLRAAESGAGPIALIHYRLPANEAACRSEVGALLGERPALAFCPVADEGDPNRLTSVCDALLPPWSDKQYRVSGSPEFTDLVRGYLLRHGVPAAAIRLEGRECE